MGRKKTTDHPGGQVPKGERRVRRWAVAAALVALSCMRTTAYELKPHPRIFVAPNGAKILAARAAGPLRSTYDEIKTPASRAVAEGIQKPRADTPQELMSLGICYLVERESGRDGKAHAGAVKAFWGDGAILSRAPNGPFGYYAIVYDWIFDSLSPDERVRYGNALGQWLRWYTDTPEITLRNGGWWYNQTWGPAHLGTRNTRDGITPKLMVALAIARRGHGARSGRTAVPGFVGEARARRMYSRLRPDGRRVVREHGPRQLRASRGDPLVVRCMANGDG